MKSDIKIFFFTLTASLLLTSCVLPIYDGDMDLSEQQSVWQYLNVFSIYHDRLPDKCGGNTPEDLFRIINDSLGGARYTEYRLGKTAYDAAASLKNQTDECDECAVFEITDYTAYIRIPDFSAASLKFFKLAVPNLERYANIVLDLRNNGGGLISVCDTIAGEFLPFNSEYIETRYRNYDTRELKGVTVEWEILRTVNQRPKLHDKNVAVLMNRNSASASEILICALKDRKDRDGAFLIGEKSYGKGIGQSHIARLGRKRLSITSMQIRGLTNRTGDYHKKGIEPDPLNNDLWEEAGTQYPHYRDIHLRNLYYAVKVLEPEADSEEVREILHENLVNLYLAKTTPIGAYFELEDPLLN